MIGELVGDEVGVSVLGCCVVGLAVVGVGVGL